MRSECAWVFGVELKLVLLTIFFSTENWFHCHENLCFHRQFPCLLLHGMTLLNKAGLQRKRYEHSAGNERAEDLCQEGSTAQYGIHTWSGELEVAECKETISLSDVSNTPAQLCDSTWHSGRWLPCNLVSTAVGHCHGALLLKA